MSYNLSRKLKRNDIKRNFKNKEVKAEFKGYQMAKYGLAEYAKMQGKSINKILNEEI